MADIVAPEIRSRMMSGIRGRNTKPELILRKGLHVRGFRFRLHAKMPGRPDMVFPKWRAVIFAHGCFWHGHDCHLFKWPKSRAAFWRLKITGNVARDAANIKKLVKAGWRVGIVWECALKGKTRLDSKLVLKLCSDWLKSNKKRFELVGSDNAVGASLRLLRRGIQHKHLVTLEPGITENQTDEMKAKHLQLVVPVAIHDTYKASQQDWLMDVADFVELVRTRQVGDSE
jgi:DNA mismatch endonuclease, patch repair protein